MLRYALFATLFAALLPGCASLDGSGLGALTAEDWFARGVRAAEGGQLDAAERAFRQAYAQGAGVRALHNLGLVQVRLGVEALNEARQQLPPEHPVHAEIDEFLRTLATP